MDNFVTNFVYASIIIKMKKDNHKKFDIIRNRINSRLISIATPAEILEMIILTRDADRLTKLLTTQIDVMAKTWNEQHPDSPVIR